jgi:hypothetical protein
MFENRVLMGTFGPQTEEVTKGWRKLSKEELQCFYFKKKYYYGKIK